MSQLSTKWIVLNVALAVVASSQLACRNSEPEFGGLTVEPAEVCPGGTVRLSARVSNGQGWRANFVERVGTSERTLSAAEALSASPEAVDLLASVCPPARPLQRQPDPRAPGGVRRHRALCTQRR